MIVFANPIIPNAGEELYYFLLKKPCIYAGCGVSQTPNIFMNERRITNEKNIHPLIYSGIALNLVAFGLNEILPNWEIPHLWFSLPISAIAIILLLIGAIKSNKKKD